MVQIKGTTIGFIGFGNMARAIVEGWLHTEAVPAENIYASRRNYEQLIEDTTRLGIHALETNQEVVEHSDIVIVAVKPHQIEHAAAPLIDLLRNKTIVSLAVNVHYDYYEKLLADGTAHLSILPNTPVSVGEGAIIFEQRHSLSDETLLSVTELFESIGVVETVATEQMGVAGVISGCGPAFASLFIEALGDGAVKYGLSRDTAYALASQTISGTGKLQLETGDHPGVMKDNVTSPGGTTIKGVTALEKSNFRSAVIEAFDAILGES